jgi:hypothetical protein
VVRVRLDRKATSIVLLVVLGVREDGQGRRVDRQEQGDDRVRAHEDADLGGTEP